jgi:anti-anti-sigma regulatory factor
MRTGKENVMNIRITEEVQWHRFTMLEEEERTGATFFPKVEGVLECIKEVLEVKKGACILFDLLAIDTIDTSIITVIVHTTQMAGVSRVGILVSQPGVVSRLSLLGLDRLAEIFGSEEAWRNRQTKP